MKMTRRFLASLLLIPLLSACEPLLIPMSELDGQPVATSLTQEQVRAAIKSAASTAGWEAQDAGPGSILATYNIRVHTVVVDISYTETGYSINYDRSNEMKVHCSEAEKTKGRIKITGPDICPDGAKPIYIHKNYQAWIDQLNAAIVRALATA